jgi:hypothetical protein
MPAVGLQRLGHEDVDSMHVAQEKGSGNSFCERSNEPSSFVNKWESFTNGTTTNASRSSLLGFGCVYDEVSLLIIGWFIG